MKSYAKQIKTQLSLSKVALATTLVLASGIAQADSFTEALTGGKTTADFNLRYESVDQDNALKDASALTLRSRLNYTTGGFQHFSATIEFEDSRNVLGVADYNNTLGEHTNYSVIADPETTEVDQMLVQYKNDSVVAKLGRQVIALDGQRFIGHVGWRQDRQTFDAARFVFTPNDALSLEYSFIDKRNRIFAQEKDIDSSDHLINASYKTAIGSFVAYGYLLEVDDAPNNGLDTYGASYAGSFDVSGQKITVNLEAATQDSDEGSASYTASYYAAEVGTAFSGVSLKLGYELLGSDDGMYGFSTPLATGHKFNGWSDQFLSTPKQGLADIYISAGGALVGGKWAVIYHDFSADESTDTIDDLGSEINAVYTYTIDKNYMVGIKAASYSAGDSAAGKVDTDKVWIWATAKF